MSCNSDPQVTHKLIVFPLPFLFPPVREDESLSSVCYLRLNLLRRCCELLYSSAGNQAAAAAIGASGKTVTWSVIGKWPPAVTQVLQRQIPFTLTLGCCLKISKIRSGRWKTSSTWYAEDHIRVKGVVLLKILLIYTRSTSQNNGQVLYSLNLGRPYTLNSDLTGMELVKKRGSEIL